MRGPESRAIIRQLVCGRYCYLMLMPLDPIDTRARDGTKNRFHAAATKRRRRPPPAGDARAPSPSRRGHGRRTPGWWCTKKLTLECYDPVYRPGPVPTCPPCTTAEPRGAGSRGRGNDPWGQRGGRNRFIAPPSPATKLYRETLLFSVSSVVWKNYEMFQGLIYYSSRLIFSFHAWNSFPLYERLIRFLILEIKHWR